MFAFTLLSLASTVNAQKEKDTRYGKNIVSFIPFAAFTKNSVGVGASYEGMEEFKVKEGEAVKRAALSVERNPLDLILL